MQCLALNHGKIRGTSSANCLPPNHYEHERFAMAAPILTQEYIKSILHYDPDTGMFTWLARDGSQFTRSGRPARSICSEGYIVIKINDKKYKAHRLAFLYMAGYFPPEETDHINRVRNDNRWCNLRAVSRAENLRNKKRYSSNTSGVSGVSWEKASGKWVASIRVNKKLKKLGRFRDIEDAVAAREAAKIDYNYHQNHGRNI